MPNDTTSHRRQLVAVWFADIAGFTRLAAAREDDAMLLVERFQTLARECVQGVGGTIVKFMGDGALATFDSVHGAVRAALDLSAAIGKPVKPGEVEAAVRVGVHLGDVIAAADGDVYGDGVNLASRLQSIAAAGQVVVSEDVWRQLRRGSRYKLTDLGERDLKGIVERVRVYAVTEAGADDTPPIATGPASDDAGSTHRRRNLAFLGLGMLLALVVFGTTRNFSSDPADEPTPAADEAPGANDPEASSELAVSPDARSIAVLPFDNFTADQEDDFFSDGITEEILTALAHVPGFKVISRTSVMQYKATTKSLRQIGVELGVATILEGSVRRQGDQVRITAQLIDARTDQHLWAETYDRDLRDAFKIQTEIAKSIAGALDAELTPALVQRLERAPTEDLAAYDLYLQGRASMGRLSLPEIDNAVGSFREALRMDPKFAEAAAGLGEAYAARAAFSGNIAWSDSAAAAASRALELDDNLAASHTSLGLAHLTQGHMSQARTAFERAATLNPNSAMAMFGLGQIHSQRGDFDQALRALLRATELEPTNTLYRAFVAWTMIDLGLLDEASRWAESALAIQPDVSVALVATIAIDLHRGDIESARQRAADMRALVGDTPRALEIGGFIDLILEDWKGAREKFQKSLVRTDDWTSWSAPGLALALSRLGRGTRAGAVLRRAEAAVRAILSEEQDWDTYVTLAEVLAVRGRVDDAVDVLEEAYERGWNRAGQARVDPMLAPLRGNPGFESLLARALERQRLLRERLAYYRSAGQGASLPESPTGAPRILPSEKRD